MTKTIYILNGPNLNMIGYRQPEIYGTDTLADGEARARAIADESGVSVVFRQSNHEGELVTWIQEARDKADAVIINPAAYSHTSVAILDALYAFEGLVIEVHLSNIHKREEFRHHSYVSERADVVIVGAGMSGYELATRHAVSVLT